MKPYTHIAHKCIPMFIDEQSTVLILGSLPSVKSREYGFYYGHPQNRFYKVLSKIFDEEEPISIKDKKQFLSNHNIALYDVIYECDIIGSSDASIINPKVIPLGDILDNYQNINTIGINGNKARTLFDRYLKQTALEHNARIMYLPSTSPANARMSVDELMEKYYILFQD